MTQIILDSGQDLENHLLETSLAIMGLMNRVEILESLVNEGGDPEPDSVFGFNQAIELADPQSPQWVAILAVSGELTDPPALTLRNRHSEQTLAKAIVAAKYDDDEMRDEAVVCINDVMLSPLDMDDVLAACRRLAAYPIAADIINLAEYDPSFDAAFRSWLAEMLLVDYAGGGGGGTIPGVQERRPNNFGTHAGASRIAVDMYLGDYTDLARAADVFFGYLGDRASYDGFSFGSDLSWQADPSFPVGINPVGAAKEGHDIDGVLPDDQRRAGSFTWPPQQENYVWEALQGAYAQALLLDIAGWNSFQWEDAALYRAVTWMYEVCNFPAEGDDSATPYLTDAYYGTDYATGVGRGGKNGLGLLYPLLAA